MTSPALAITHRFRAHNCAENTSVQNKRYIVPHILKTREPRDSDRIPGNILQEPGKQWNGYTWKNDEGDLVYENFKIEADDKWGSNLFENGEAKPKRPGKYIWRNGYIGPKMDPFNSYMHWGTREWNVPHREFIDCDFFAIPKEHGLYISVYEGTVVDRCTFVRMGSQGVQIVHRVSSKPPYSYSGDNRPYDAKPLHILNDTHFIDCANQGARPSFNASYFNPGSPEFPGTLKVTNCSFVADWEEPAGYLGNHSTGGLVVTPMGSNEVLTGNMMELVEVKNCLFDFHKPDRSSINIRSTDKVVIEDCTFIVRNSSRGEVAIDKPNGWMGDTKTKRIVLRNNLSPSGTQLHINLENTTVKHDMHTPGKEVIIDGETGAVISERKIGPASDVEKKRLAASLEKDRRDYYGS